MNYFIYKPQSYLRHYIKCIWALQCNGDVPQMPIPPTGSAEILLSTSSKITTQINKTEASSHSVIIGQRSAQSIISGSCVEDIISIMLTPYGVSTLLGYSGKEFTNSCFNGQDIWGSEAEVLEEKLAESSGFTQRCQVLLSYFHQRVRKIHRVHKQLNAAIAALTKAGGNIPLEKLAYDVCLSPRQLQRIFKEEVGLSPKAFSQVLRFQKALYIKEQHPEISLLQLSLDSGFSDQAHFNRAFKQFTGFSPKNYFDQFDAFSDYYNYL